jgi:hypothetical protein
MGFTSDADVGVDVGDDSVGDDSDDSGGGAARIVTAGRWIGISTDRGTGWWRGQSGLALNPRLNPSLNTHRA